MIRSNEQSSLAEWLAIGRGMLLRYDELHATDVAPCADTLATIIKARTPLLDRLAQADAARGDLPPSGDREVNELNALIDNLLIRLFGEDPVRQRLLNVEQHWYELLASGNDLDWTAEENDLLLDLQQDSRNAIDALLACAS